MFIVKDTRKFQDILQDEDLRELKLARRPGEFKSGDVSTLCRASHAAQLKPVEYLSLYANQLTSVRGLNHGLAGGKLRELNLGNNKLTDLPPEIALLAPSLQKLWLDDNQFARWPAAVLELGGLKALRLSRNQLTALPAQIRMLSNLEDLAVDNNQLKELPPTIGDLTNLTALNVRQNQLAALPPELWRGLAHCLVVLNASSNQLGANARGECGGTNDPRDPLAGLRALQRLEELRLNGNQLTAFPLEALALPTLKVLNVANNAVPHPLPAAVAAAWGGLDPKGTRLESTAIEVTVRGNPFCNPPAAAAASD